MNTEGKILRRTSFVEYRLLDYIPIMTKILEQAIITKKNSKKHFTNIPLAKVWKFELLYEPSKFWLNEIEKAEENILPDAEGNQYYPGWFHQIIRIPKERLNKGLFKKWQY